MLYLTVGVTYKDMKKRVNESRIIERTKCSRSVAKAASHLKILGDVFYNASRQNLPKEQ